mgnify:CR=1 FL=1
MKYLAAIMILTFGFNVSAKESEKCVFYFSSPSSHWASISHRQDASS